MIFRIGGLFICVVVGAAALSNVSPFSGIGYKSGLLLTVIAYASLVSWSLWKHHQKLKSQQASTPKAKNLPPWPRQAWGLPIVGSATAMLLVAEFVHETVWLSVLRSAGTALLGLGFLMLCKVALQQGYFPGGWSQYGKHRGISREEDATQFFATVFLFLILAGSCFYGSFIFLQR